jgi:hypothetical protein
VTTTELDELFCCIGRQRFMAHAFRSDRNGPEVLAFVHYWAGGTADVVMIFDEEKACAYRTAGTGGDVFAPELVSWWYLSNAVWTLRALITLPEPGRPEEPCEIMRPPLECTLPAGNRIPVRVRARLR